MELEQAYPLFKSEPAAAHAQRDTDEEPDQDNGQHRGKRHGAAGPLDPQEEVEEEKHGESDHGDDDGSEDDQLLPLLPTKGFVAAGGDVATNKAEKRVENKDHGAQEAAVRWRKEAEQSKDCLVSREHVSREIINIHTNCGTRHHKQLRAITNENTQQQRMLRAPKHVPVYQLPPRIFLDAILHCGRRIIQIVQINHVQAVISRNILLERPHQDRAHQRNQQHDKHRRINQRVPMHTRVVDVQVLVPARGPRRLGLPPRHAVRPLDLCLGAVFLVQNYRGIGAAIRASVVANGASGLRVRIHHDADDAVLVLAFDRRDAMHVDDELVMVVQHRLSILVDTSKRETGGVKLLPAGRVQADLRRRKPIDQPVDVIPLKDLPVHVVGTIRVKRDLSADAPAGLVILQLQVERGCPYPVAKDDASQGLADILSPILGHAKVEFGLVVVEGDHGVELLVVFSYGGREAVDM